MTESFQKSKNSFNKYIDIVSTLDFTEMNAWSIIDFKYRYINHLQTLLVNPYKIQKISMFDTDVVKTYPMFVKLDELLCKQLPDYIKGDIYESLKKYRKSYLEIHNIELYDIYELDTELQSR